MSTARHRRVSRRPRRAAVVGTVTAAAVMLSAGSAAAYWRTTGSGNGSASTGTKVGITFTATAVIDPAGTLLYPTGPKAGIKFTLQPSTANYKATSMAQDGTRVVTVSAGTGTCSASVIAVDSATMNKTVTTAGGAQTVTIPAVVKLADTAPIECQGRTFLIPLIITGVLV